MKLGTMFQDIVESFFKKSATQLYPVERICPPERYRGKLFYTPSACTGCRLCVKDCPSNAIELFILDRSAKQYVLEYHMDRCIYCGQCMTSVNLIALTCPIRVGNMPP
jgi:formate hydrogenlyase subunit 6/NADH:ubiquinone oxidoreductase subunit I